MLHVYCFCLSVPMCLQGDESFLQGLGQQPASLLLFGDGKWIVCNAKLQKALRITGASKYQRQKSSEEMSSWGIK